MLIRPIDENNLLPSITEEPEIYQLQEPYVSLPPKVDNYFPERALGNDFSYFNINLIGGGVAGVNNIGTINCENIAVLDDLFNFGYKVKLVDSDDILTRVNDTTYTNDLSSIVLDLMSYDTGWRLTTTEPSINFYYNFKFTPVGLFTGSQNLSVIYTNE
jgi:hypothetical protein